MLLPFLFMILGGANARGAEASSAELLTLGPGGDVFSYFGHSVLCVTHPGAPEGACFDFGIPTAEPQRNGEVDLVWDSLRGRARFHGIAVPRHAVLRVAEEMDRTLERQVLPIATEELPVFEAVLREEAAKPYAYHPYTRNCTTRVRDLLDRHWNGKVVNVALEEAFPRAPTYLAFAEQGFAGHPIYLAMVDVFFGAWGNGHAQGADRIFSPGDLRDAVRRLGAQPETLRTRLVHFEGSPNVGRWLLAAIGVVLAGWVLMTSRRHGPDGPIRWLMTGFGALAALSYALLAMTVYHELRVTCLWLVLIPLDALAPWLGAVRLQRWLRFRVATLVVVLAASALGIIDQLVWPMIALVALPYLAGLRAMRSSRSTPT